MKKAFLLTCGLSSVFGCIGIGNFAYAKTTSEATVAPISQEVLLLPESDLEPLPPVKVTQPEDAPAPMKMKVEAVTTKAGAVKMEPVNIASTKATVPAPPTPKFVRVPMRSRIFPALFQ